MISDDFQIGPNGAYEHVGNNLDLQYQLLLQDILDNGVEKKDRTGTGTKSVFGRQIRHKMSDGFPLLTTKKMPFKTITTELLWFLRGDTNIKYLVDNNCHIWDGDAYKNYLHKVIRDKDIVHYLKSYSVDTNGVPTIEPYSKDEFIERIKNDTEFAKKWGELGPIYGKQWRSWGRKNVTNYDLKDVKGSDQHKVIKAIENGEDVTKYGVKIEYQNNLIDQIQNLINELKTNPDSRRLMVNAWNVSEIDQMVLPPCHYGFQVYTRELSEDERYDLCAAQKSKMTAISEEDYIKYNIPTRAISLMWNQRSVDTFLGLPFNIASYGLLLTMIADEMNMVPDELIGNLGDVHLYSNHIDQAKEQIGRELTLEERLDLIKDNKDFLVKLGPFSSEYEIMRLCDEFLVPRRTREPMKLPTVHVRDGIYCSSTNDVILENYQSHPAIKAPLSN